ncbi:hypothetical protein LCGC14_1326270 [marine sediment metagenome]|uniref:Uncharacterized protein n=1 Tax=marine sediment metagenome TaxID=412755 RepID=A0A0F9L3Y3_9ZZZZ
MSKKITRKCSRCKIVKELCAKNFSQDKGRKFGFAYWCKPCARKANKKWTDNNPESNRARALRWKRNNPLKHKYKEYKHSAKRRGLVFPLTIKVFEDIIKEPCHFCGTKLAGGIDRKDNSQGYLIKNCLPCCQYCNRAKYTRSYEEFREWIDQLIHYQSMNIGTKSRTPNFYT